MPKVIKKGLLLLMSPLEVCVAETLLVRVITCLVEVVHVQLPDEGWEVIVFEKPRKYPLRELVRLFHNETVADVIPADYMV